MRQSQQKNRMRGRGRKGPSPLSRSYESNGPDVKIRGTAAHIAEKYASLARDALAIGDNVIAENYLQHAEHYNRIVAAAAAAQSSRSEESGASLGRGPQPNVAGEDDDGGEQNVGEVRAGGNGRNSQPVGDVAAGQEGSDRGDASEQRERPEGRGRRRPRKSEPSERSVANGANGAETGDGAERPKRAGISSDASMLPDSILGAGPAMSEEKAAAEE